MKPLAIHSNTVSPTDETATLVVSTVPMVMRAIRAEMRAHRPKGLSVLQFRALLRLDTHPGISVSGVAEHLGLTLSTVSKLVDGLLKRGYVERTVAANDRRRAILALTDAGKTELESTRAATQSQMVARLTALSPEEQQAVSDAMHALHNIFNPDTNTH